MADANTKLLLHMNGADGSTSFIDSSPSGHIVTANRNAQIDTAQAKFGTASGLFDGTQDNLSVPDHADWDFGTGDFTIDFQVRFNSAIASFGAITDSTGVGGWIYLFLDNVGGWIWSLNIENTTYTFATWTPSIDTWYHIALVRSGTDVLLFIDGTQSGTTKTNSSNISTTGSIIIGARFNEDLSLSGWLDEFRVSNTARWTANFTAPSAEYNGESGGSGGSGGDGNTYNITAGFGGMGMFDFGATNLRWLVVGAGTGVYASSNLGLTFVSVATSRTQTYQNFERSRSVLVCTTDAYNTPLYWTGSVGTYASLLNASAPLAKYAVNFQGFLILLNTSTSPRGFYYEDANTQLTGDWGDSFILPSTADDEITAAVVLNKKLYVSTRYRLFRITYIGGNPDWTYLEVKDWGFVPRTVKKITLSNIGEVIVGMSWDKRIRLFDGSDDRIISDNVENDNGMSDFALEKIYTQGSGLRICVSEMDRNEQVYKLCVALGGSSYVTHMLNFDGRTMSFYPYARQNWQSIAMAESADKLYLMAADSNGFVYMLNTGWTDRGTAISDVYDSPFFYSRSPSSVSKLSNLDFYFSPRSSNDIYYSDRVNFDTVFRPKTTFRIADTNSTNMIKKTIDIPQTLNVYQYQITSSSNTAEPWRLNRTDIFIEEKGIGAG